MLPENYKFDGKTSKLLLRTIHNKYIPNKTINILNANVGIISSANAFGRIFLECL